MPDLVPARMFNEHAYCPRLFFLEWVGQLWAASAGTAEGDCQHRRVDAGGGAAPLPAEGALEQARSVELASERLGITATPFGMRGDVEARMKLSEDSVMIVDLGAAGDSSRFLFLGHHERQPPAAQSSCDLCERCSALPVPGERSHAGQLSVSDS